MKRLVWISVFTSIRTADSETVWLKDVTRRFETNKRKLNDPDLPEQLSFQLKRELSSLTINLQRNHQIYPNSDVYIVRKMNDGRSRLEKTEDLANEVRFHGNEGNIVQIL
ncbi:hypothetical protein CHS0354_026049 [Potamilus streckersoni]|uniref:Uncharacterized protein n=1 Tax=Potamilus streckersoni TaxID=2493646 RepID=A0AAE0SFE8_9BIVA|nr:hypothetical protein CHS0354_026049 [Potamilus streckersoni]